MKVDPEIRDGRCLCGSGQHLSFDQLVRKLPDALREVRHLEGRTANGTPALVSQGPESQGAGDARLAELVRLGAPRVAHDRQRGAELCRTDRHVGAPALSNRGSEVQDEAAHLLPWDPVPAEYARVFGREDGVDPPRGQQQRLWRVGAWTRREPSGMPRARSSAGRTCPAVSTTIFASSRSFGKRVSFSSSFLRCQLCMNRMLRGVGGATTKILTPQSTA